MNRKYTNFNQLINGEFEVLPRELIDNSKKPFKAMLQVNVITGERIIDRRDEVYWR